MYILHVHVYRDFYLPLPVHQPYILIIGHSHLSKQYNPLPHQAEEDSDIWRRYLEYLDEIVLDGLFTCIQCSLQYLLDNTSSGRTDMPPLLEAKLELQAPEMVFQPSLDQDASDGFLPLMESFLEDIFRFGSIVPRIAQHLEPPHYQTDVEEIVELVDMREEVMTRVEKATDRAVEHRNSYTTYSYLWVDDRHEFLRQFLLYGHVLSAEEVDAAGEEGVPESPPTLNRFKEQVDSYEKVYKEVEKFEGMKVFDVWFRVDARPFKEALLTIVKRWSFMFKQHLIDHVTNRWVEPNKSIIMLILVLGLIHASMDYQPMKHTCIVVSPYANRNYMILFMLLSLQPKPNSNSRCGIPRTLLVFGCF